MPSTVATLLACVVSKKVQFIYEFLSSLLTRMQKRACLVNSAAVAGACHEQEIAEPGKADGAAGQRVWVGSVTHICTQPVLQRAAGRLGAPGRQAALTRPSLQQTVKYFMAQPVLQREPGSPGSRLQ